MFRKQLIKLNNRLEGSWRELDLNQSSPDVEAGWYVAEFVCEGLLETPPRLVIKGNKEQDRQFIGAHSGRNRMLIYLPEGRLIAHSASMSIERLALVPNLESRFRILLICLRYLRDFPNPVSFFRVFALQFRPSIQLSNTLLAFYEPARGGRSSYLDNILFWKNWKRLGRFVAWFYRGIKIGVVIEDERQRSHLEKLLVTPDVTITANDAFSKDIHYWIALGKHESLRFASLLLIKRAISKSNNAALIYSDHDYVTEQGQDVLIPPVFKPVSPLPTRL